MLSKTGWRIEAELARYTFEMLSRRHTITGTSNRLTLFAFVSLQPPPRSPRERGPEGDCIVAGTALVINEPIVTRNVNHFDRFDDLELIEY